MVLLRLLLVVLVDTYSWSPSGGTAATATGLSAGTHGNCN
jgi:hypothetical protein